MLKKIIKGYGEILSSFVKILFLLGLCAACGALAVFPLWKFSTATPDVYSTAVLVAAALIILFIIIQKIRKNGVKSALIAASKILIVAGGLAAIFILVISGLRILSLPVILVMLVLYGIISFNVKASEKKELSNESAEN